MAELAPSSSSLRKHKVESDMEAAQKLMQLSDEENSSSNINGSKCKRRSLGEEQEVDQRPKNNDTVMAKIQEIFGKDIEDFPPKKQRRYRSLVNIYLATRPIHDNAAAGNDRIKA